MTPERGPSRLDARGGLRSSPRAALETRTLAHPGKLRDVSDKIDVKKLDPLNVGGKINDKLDSVGGNAGWLNVPSARFDDSTHQPA